MILNTDIFPCNLDSERSDLKHRPALNFGFKAGVLLAVIKSRLLIGWWEKYVTQNFKGGDDSRLKILGSKTTAK